MISHWLLSVGGVTKTNDSEFIQAGAKAVGTRTSLFGKNHSLSNGGRDLRQCTAIYLKLTLITDKKQINRRDNVSSAN
jgi:2-keto-3-deoxy-6-phosphogluconate aldolase